MDKIDYFDNELIFEIVSDVPLKMGNIDSNETFWGYKKNKENKLFDFFFSVYDKKYLTFTFREIQDISAIVRVYVTNSNYLNIKAIIENIMANKEVDRSLYEDQLCYEYDRNSELINNRKNIQSSNADEALGESEHKEDDYEESKEDKMNLEIKNEFFDYSMNKYYKKSCEEKYLEFGKEIVNYLTNLINDKINNDRRKTIFALYKKLNRPYKYRIRELANVLNMEKVEVSSIVQRNVRILSRYRSYFVEKINDIVGEEQYNYLIDGIIKASNHGFLFLIFDIICKGSKKEALKYKRQLGGYHSELTQFYPNTDIFELSDGIDYSILKTSNYDDDGDDSDDSEEEIKTRTFIVGQLKDIYHFGRCVKIDDTVKIRYLSNNKTDEFTIKFLHHQFMPTLESYTSAGISYGVRDVIDSNEIDHSKNEISDESPLGRKIIGRALHDIVIINSPDGDYAIEIIEIK